MKITKKLFFVILLIGFFLRIYNVANIPASLHVDEVSYGYNAYSILTTGKDEYGVPFPIFFKATGEYKSPIPVYSMVPFIYLFGLNAFSVRFYSVIYGVLGIIAIYLLTKELFDKHPQAEIIALFAMFFLAISPWDIHFSRIAWDITPFIFFTTLGAYLILKSQKIPKLLPFAIVSWMLAIYSYFVSWIVIPFFGLMFFILYFKLFFIHKKETLISFVILLVMLIPILQNTLSSHGLVRWQQVSIFSNPPHNQSIFDHILINYIRHFSVDFLFLKGDSGMPGQPNTYDSVHGMGELYIFQLPLLLIGIYKVFKTKTKTRFLLFTWLLLYPLGSMFTDRESPLARRSVIGVIPFQIISAYGLFYFLEVVEKIKKGRTLLIVITAFIITFSFVYYLYLYFVTYPNYSSDYYGFQYGSKQIVSYFATHESSYNDLVMSPYIFSPYIYFKFFQPHDCQKCQTGVPDRLFNPQRKQLFAVPPYYIASHNEFTYMPVSYIYYPNGSLAFVLTQIRSIKH
jgi:4-amino-4-deoxy-L-arabinose transferase-like glycosyltransferase